MKFPCLLLRYLNGLTLLEKTETAFLTSYARFSISLFGKRDEPNLYQLPVEAEIFHRHHVLGVVSLVQPVLGFSDGFSNDCKMKDGLSILRLEPRLGEGAFVPWVSRLFEYMYMVVGDNHHQLPFFRSRRRCSIHSFLHSRYAAKYSWHLLLS